MLLIRAYHRVARRRRHATHGARARLGARHQPGRACTLVGLETSSSSSRTRRHGSTSRRSKAALGDRTSPRSCSPCPTRSASSSRTSREIADADPRRGRAALPGRRQPERAGRAGAAGRHGLRRHAHQPAQDVLDAARRRRPGRRAGRGGARTSSRSCRRRVVVTSADGALRLDARPPAVDRPGALASTATSASSCAPTPTSARSGPDGLTRGEPRRDPQRQLPACAGSRARSTCRIDAALHARVRALGHGPAQVRRADARRGQAAARLRRPRADGLLPAHRRGGAHDRADRDRDAATRSTTSPTSMQRIAARGRDDASDRAPARRTRRRSSRLDEGRAARELKLPWKAS